MLWMPRHLWPSCSLFTKDLLKAGGGVCDLSGDPLLGLKNAFSGTVLVSINLWGLCSCWKGLPSGSQGAVFGVVRIPKGSSGAEASFWPLTWRLACGAKRLAEETRGIWVCGLRQGSRHRFAFLLSFLISCLFFNFAPQSHYQR